MCKNINMKRVNDIYIHIIFYVKHKNTSYLDYFKIIWNIQHHDLSYTNFSFPVLNKQNDI